MNCEKVFYLIVFVDCFLLLGLTFFSFRLLVGEWQKVQAVNPEILAQYRVHLEVDKFIELVKELKK